MDDFGRKIAEILDKAPLDKKIEDRLVQARKIALERAKKSNFIEITTPSSGVLKAKSKLGAFHDNFKWFIWLSIGMMFLVLQQGYMYSTEESEAVQYLSPDYVQYKEKLNMDQEKFSAWKEDINNLIDKDDN